MIRLRHFAHPIRSATSLFRRAKTSYVQSAISNIRRGHRDSCWCGGDLVEFERQPAYGICRECGCYVNRVPPLPEELQRLYSFNFYWHTLQRFRGHPIIEERTSFDKQDGRVQYWLSLIDTYSPPGDRVLEVGCAHAVLLRELANRGFKCTGVEVDPDTAEWTRKRTGLHILPGVFPGLDAPPCDLFLSFDVIEHALSPDIFLNEVARLLGAGGIAIVQTQIEFEKLDPPFGEMFPKVFDDAQHLFAFSRKGIALLAERAGLELLLEDPWRLGQELVVLKKNGLAVQPH